MRDDALGAVTRYRDKYYPTPALQPLMRQLPARSPAAPDVTGVARSGGTATLTWRPGPGAPPTSYAVYRGAQLIATLRGESYVDRAPTGARYCVSALDRSGNEGPLTTAA